MILIYGNEACVWCLRAKKLAEDYDLKFEWKDTHQPDILVELKEKLPEIKTVPQIWWHDRYIGGYQEFTVELENTMNGYGDGRL